ncbi:MAG: mRNA surveillance protein pelota [Euryarchaeota archaeon]|nr:mRNA surveillance protein pelota [Euryarchaeota archaeon]
MKIIDRKIKNGFIRLRAETIDDLWHLKHIIREEDLIEGKTFRREEQKADKIRDERTDKKPVYLKIRAEKIEFHKETNRVRVTGVIEEGEDVGRHHTFNIEEGTVIGITKEWKDHELRRVDEAVRDTNAPRILILAMEMGEATFGIVRGYGIDFLADLNENIPGKYYTVKRNDPRRKFFESTAKKMERALDKYAVEKMIIAGPGFVKQEFVKYLKMEYPQLDGKYVLRKASTAGKTGVHEVIRKGDLEDVYKDSRVSREMVLVEELSRKILTDEAVYGIETIKKALSYGAVETLLIVDELLRDTRYEKIMEKARQQRAEVCVISSEHEGGEKLQGLGGIAGILRFKIS